MNYRQTTEYLFTAMPSFQNVGGDAYKPGLERIDNFCCALGAPHLSYPTIHIAGTNGKGSTSNMLASVLMSSGYRVGLFTSPHLRDFRERMRINGEMIGEEEVVAFVAQHKVLMEQMGLSFFEMTAAMAFDFFARNYVDIAVIECGLGGRLDATNIVDPLLSVITNIGIDHTQFLGDTLPKIAAEKGGIIKPQRNVVIGEMNEEYNEIFTAIARRQKAPLQFAEMLYSTTDIELHKESQRITVQSTMGETLQLDLDLRGEYQCRNLVTLLAAIEQLNTTVESSIKISREALTHGLRHVTQQMHLEGRWQKLCDTPLMVCDTGHNLAGLIEVTKQIKATRYTKLYCVVGFAKDKDVAQILRLFPSDAHFIFTRPNVERAHSTERLLEIASTLRLSCEAVERVSHAVERAKNLANDSDLVFIGGSNFVVAEIL